MGVGLSLTRELPVIAMSKASSPLLQGEMSPGLEKLEKDLAMAVTWDEGHPAVPLLLPGYLENHGFTPRLEVNSVYALTRSGLYHPRASERQGRDLEDFSWRERENMVDFLRETLKVEKGVAPKVKAKAMPLSSGGGGVASSDPTPFGSWEGPWSSKEYSQWRKMSRGEKAAWNRRLKDWRSSVAQSTAVETVNLEEEVAVKDEKTPAPVDEKMEKTPDLVDETTGKVPILGGEKDEKVPAPVGEKKEEVLAPGGEKTEKSPAPGGEKAEKAPASAGEKEENAPASSSERVAGISRGEAREEASSARGSDQGSKRRRRRRSTSTSSSHPRSRRRRGPWMPPPPWFPWGLPMAMPPQGAVPKVAPPLDDFTARGLPKPPPPPGV